MADPQAEIQGTTHTYLSAAMHKDWAVLLLVGAIVFDMLQDRTFVETFIPHQYHELITKIVLFVALYIRIYKTKRPVAIFEGTPVEVKSLPPQVPTVVDLGKVGKP